MAITPESVKAQLNSQDLGDRLRAVNQMRELEPEVAFDLLQVAAKDSNTRVRYAAISQVATAAQANPGAALNLLRDRLNNDPEADVQAAAADSIGGLQLTEAFDDLAQVYQNSNEWLVRFSIIAALGELGEARSFDLLEAALADDNSLILTAAIGSLGELGDPRAVPLLLTYVNNPDWQVRHRLAQALNAFEQAEAQQALKTLAEDSSEIVAQAAQHYLAAP